MSEIMLPPPPNNLLELMVSFFAIKMQAGHQRLAWRGHANSAWPLETTLHRHARISGLDARRYELTVVNEFIVEAPGLTERVPAVHDTAGWLVLMRHHGLPVRLLDWTWNPLVAAYFAVSSQPETTATIWGLNTAGLNRSFGCNTGLGSLYAGDGDMRTLAKYPFNGTECPSAVFAVAAPHSSRRIAAQQGLFTIHGAAAPLEQLPQAASSLFKIEIPATAKDSIRKDLEFLGIAPRHILADLDTLASDLRSAARSPTVAE